MRTFDLAIIGSGSGGTRAAELAARRGARVVLVEQELLGGTCLHTGCVPLSLLAKNARRWRAWRSDPLQQVARPAELLADWMGATRRHIARESAQLYDRLRGLGVSLEGGRGRLEDARHIAIERGIGVSERLMAERVILATGARPAVSRFPGRVDVRGMLHSCEEPKDLTIVGGGHIGCEFAGIFNALGSHVTILEKGPRLLPELDAEAGTHLESIFRSRGIEISCNTTAGDELGAEAAPSRAVLWATGRIPNVENLGLQEAGIERRGEFIAVDEHLRTTVEGIYAIGDVNGLDGLATGARAQARVAVENAFGGSEVYSPGKVPRAYWTQPAVASVGWQEADARAAGYQVRVGRDNPRVRASRRGASDDQAVSFVKLVADARSGALLGAVLVGEHAGDLISVLSMALNYGADLDELCTSLVSPALADALAECQGQMRD